MIAGPSERAGSMEAPLTGSANRPASAIVAPTASAASGPEFGKFVTRARPRQAGTRYTVRSRGTDSPGPRGRLPRRSPRRRTTMQMQATYHSPHGLDELGISRARSVYWNLSTAALYE